MNTTKKIQKKHFPTGGRISTFRITFLNLRTRVNLKQEIGLLEGISIIVGIILGSGIFITPADVLRESGSIGLTLVIWVLCGMLSMLGAMCYAELGTIILRSGGDYAYILESYRSLLAFLFLWDAIFIIVPTTNAIMGLTFASYIIKPFYPMCPKPDIAERLLAAATICLFTFINCWNMRVATICQNLFMFAKIGAVSFIVITGLYMLCTKEESNLKNVWKDTTENPGKIAVAFYAGLFCYTGWNYLNFVTEELKDPYVNLPRAIYISVPIVTGIYVITNIAYLSVLSPKEMIKSKTIAVTFARNIFEPFSWMMSLLVAIGAAGSLCVHIMTSSRMCFVGARHGHFPAMLSHISITKLTPIPALVFMNILSLLMLITNDIYALVTYMSFVESFFIMITVSSLLYLRRVRPDIERPIKVSLVIPIIFIMVSMYLVIMPCYVKPYEVSIGILVTLTGIPVYYCCIVWRIKPRWFQLALHELTLIVQKLFLTVQED